MKKNPDYHHGPSFVKNKGPAYVDQWIVRFIPEQATLIGELTSGNVDLSDYVTERDIEKVKSSKNTNLVTAKSTSAIYIAINCAPDNKPFNDPKMRSALAHSINADAVRKAALSGVGDPLYTYISSQTMGFDKPAEEIAKPLIAYDPAKAKAILDELGWKDSGKGYRQKDGQPLEANFLAFSIPRYKRVAEVATPMLEKVGFKVNLQILEAGNLYEKTLKGEHDLLSTAYVGGSGIALDDLVASMHSKNLKANVQWAHFSNPEMDRLLDTARFDLDPEKRKAALNAAQELAAREIPCIPIANALEIFGYKKDIGVENYITHPWAFDQADEWRGLEVYRK
jgi:peptide/nickel transport system substrate-binding protein